MIRAPKARIARMTSVCGEEIVSVNRVCSLENAKARNAFAEETASVLIVNKEEFVKEKSVKKEGFARRKPLEAAILESARAKAASLGPSAPVHNAKESLSNLFPVQQALR
jgi:hypothetical protein